MERRQQKEDYSGITRRNRMVYYFVLVLTGTLCGTYGNGSTCIRKRRRPAMHKYIRVDSTGDMGWFGFSPTMLISLIIIISKEFSIHIHISSILTIVL